MNRLPDFLIVGVQKAGTTSIAEYLNQHPKCGISKIKEPSFFSYYGLPKEKYLKLKEFNKSASSFDVVTDFENYLNLFPKKSIIGEASTHYFYFSKRTIVNIKKFYGKDYKNLKIIIILRDPVERAFSAWSMFVRDGKEKRPFLLALKESKETAKKMDIVEFDYIGFSLYSESLMLFLDEFENVKIILFEDFKKNPLKVIQDIYGFLGIEKEFIPDVSLRFNPSGKPKNKLIYDFIIGQNPIKSLIKPFIPENTRKRIRTKIQNKLLNKIKLSLNDRYEALKFFIEDIEKVEVILKKDLSLWKK